MLPSRQSVAMADRPKKKRVQAELMGAQSSCAQMTQKAVLLILCATRKLSPELKCRRQLGVDQVTIDVEGVGGGVMAHPAL